MIRKLASSLLTLAALVSAGNVVCRAESRPLLTRHTREATVNRQAPLVGRLPESQSMRIVLMLPLRDQAGLDAFLKEAYDPSSASYRKFLTVQQFTQKFGPAAADYASVKQWASDNGFTVARTSRNRMIVQVIGSVATIEKALHVKMNVYQHPTEARTFYAPDREPTLDLPFQMWHISGLDNYSIPKTSLAKRDASDENTHSNATTGSGPSASFLGSDMRAAYYGGTTLNGAGQSLGLLEYAGTDLTDLTTYYKNVDQINNVPVTLLSTDGTPTNCVARQGCDDTEQTIDMTQALGMAPGLDSLVMYVGSTDAAIFNAMAEASPLNAQLSCSWYWSPADPNTLNPIFEEFAAQGQNLFDAAGDDGKWPPGIWPADNAYLTAVGGTDLDTASAGGPWASETAWADGGGGISPNGIPIPSWQVTTAAGCTKCSQTLRNAPDVSANSNFTFYVCADQTSCSANEYGGTSFAAPMWAGYLALVNQQYLSNGNTTTLGFINPAIYDIGLGSSYDTDFHDITSGSNGYTATVGFDLATGWGSPNGANLISALAGNPVGNFTMAVAPKKATIAPGGAGNVKITTTASGGFDSAITLSATGQPSGVKVAFQPATITGSGTSAMRIQVSSSAKAGTYTITITGKGGTVTQTATFTLTIS
jgi:kumamolisin